MIPGEYFIDGPELKLNAERDTCVLAVENRGDRPVQVGSHYHFFEVNRALTFNRQDAYGMRLDIPAGTAVRFEPGEKMNVQLLALAGVREVYGGNGLVMGKLDQAANRKKCFERIEKWQAGELPFSSAKKLLTGKPAKAKKKQKKS